MSRQFVLLCAFFFLFLFPVLLLCGFFYPPVLPKNTLSLLLFSFSLAFWGTLLSLLIGLPVAFCAAGRSFFAKLLASTALVPFFLPVSISGILVYQIFQDFSRLFSIDGRGTFIGLILTHGFYEAPVVIFYAALALRNIPSIYFVQMQEDNLPAFRRHLFCLDMIHPQILQAAAIVFLYIFQSTALVMNIGLGRYETFESAILLALGMRSDFASAIGLGLVQALFLLVLFSLAAYKSHMRFSLSQDRQQRHIQPSFYNYFCSALFLILISYWLSPLFIHALGGLRRLLEIRHLFPLWSALLNSLFISVLASLAAVSAVSLWLFCRGGKELIYAMIISQALYFSGIMFCGLLWNIPGVFLAVWALSLSLIPILYFFLKSAEAGEDREIIQAARLDGACGWSLWHTVYWPLWKERYVNAFGKGVLLAFGNFPFAYIMAQNKIPMAAMTLTDLLNRRYIAAANAYAGIIFILMLIILLFLSRKKSPI